MSELTNIAGIGPKKQGCLNRLGIFSLSDAKNYYPTRYEDKTKLTSIINVQENDKICIKAYITKVTKATQIRKGLEINKIYATDYTSTMEITLYNQKYVASNLKVGEEYIFYGVAARINSKVLMNSPSIEKYTEKSERIDPVYSICKGISQNDVRKVIDYALKNEKTEDIIPIHIVKKYKLDSKEESLEKIHFPKDLNDVLLARRRISFEMSFIYTLKTAYLKQRRQKIKSFKLLDCNFDEITKKLPYSLTNAQKKSIDECILDMKSGIQMNRLIQGDVGSGKTIVATILSALSAKNKKQVAFMVPTEVLARQHYDEIKVLLSDFNIALLTGSVTQKNKKNIYSSLANGEIDIVIGTHAIISDNVAFLDLGLIIVDEQHRFGVMQRAKLIDKGQNPHILVMSATPIPRTLSLILYGDLDISVIDEVPKGRIPIETFVVGENMRSRIYSFIKKHIEQGEQAYIVCPLVSESETIDITDATTYYDNLKNIFPEYNIGLLHGKMKALEKDEIMQKFMHNEVQVLVSTSVIEVGVNVKNATVMVIENAERFGLLALHQLRGRVGRGSAKSYCILFNKTSTERLEILARSNDGFEISKEDLQIRGSGDFFGTRQHGESILSSEFFDIKILKYADIEAKLLIESDEKLQKNEKLRDIIQEDLTNSSTNIYN